MKESKFFNHRNNGNQDISIFVNFFTTNLYPAINTPYFLFIERHIRFELQNSSQEIASNLEKPIGIIDIIMSSVTDKTLTVTRVSPNNGGAYRTYPIYEVGCSDLLISDDFVIFR